MYPIGSGYRHKTHASLDASRTLSIEQGRRSLFARCMALHARQVRQYHSAYYVPHNLCVIVMGAFDKGTASLLQVLQEQVEPSIMCHCRNQGPWPADWKRPFVETASAVHIPLVGEVKETIKYPDYTEWHGSVLIQFHGPAPRNYLECYVSLFFLSLHSQLTLSQALRILNAYLMSACFDGKTNPSVPSFWWVIL